MSRLDALKDLVAQAPGDSRVRFMLAMEHVNAGQYAEARSQFDELITRDENYVSAYFMAGRACESAGQIEDARSYLERGITRSNEIGDAHAAAEMQEALDLLL